MPSRLLALLCSALATASAFSATPWAARTPLVSSTIRQSHPHMALDEAREKLIKGGLPKKFAERVSFQSGGSKKAGQEEEILILWNEFKKCYRSKDVALDMLSKNTAVILPTLNSPRKIKGTYALLNKRLGKARATEVLEKNPGVLVCSPESLAKQSDDDIVKAADLVASLDANKGTINAVAGLFFFSIVASVAYRIGSVGASPPIN
jgi:hypothetical protein